jgi:hypothetical protein
MTTLARQPTQAWRPDRRRRGPAHMGPDLDASSTRALRRARRRPVARRNTLDRRAAELLPSR